MMNKEVFCFLALGILLLFASVYRSYGLDNQSIWNDESYSINSVLGFNEGGFDNLPGVIDTSYSFVDIGELYVSGSIFGWNEFAYRLPSVIFGIATVLIVFLLALRMFGYKVALLSAAFITFATVEIAWSRQARMYSEFQFFYFLSLYFFYLFVNENSRKYACLFIFSAIITFFTHRFGLFLLPVCVLYSLVNNWDDIRGNLLNYRGVFVLILFAILFLPLVLIFDLYSRVPDYLGWSNWYQYYSNYFVGHFGVFIVLAIFGSFCLLRRNRCDYLFLVLAFGIPFLFLSFMLSIGIGYRFIYCVLPILFILSAYLIVELTEGIWKENRHISVFFLSVTLVLVFFFSECFTFVPKNEYYGFEPSTHQSDLKSSYEYVDLVRTEEDIVIDAWYTIGLHYWDEDPDYNLLFYGLKFYGDVVPLVETCDELVGVINNSHGYLVIDDVGIGLLSEDSHLGNSIVDILSGMSLVVKFESPGDDAFVYRF